LGEEISKGKDQEDQAKARRRFTRYKTTLMKIDYQSKAIRITLRLGLYSFSW